MAEKNMNNRPDSYTIRAYRPEDYPGVLHVIRSVYDEYRYVLDLEQFDSDLVDIDSTYIESNGAFWVLETNLVVAGTVAVLPRETDECELKRLYLMRPYRGRGWGRKLLRTVIDWAGQNGCRRIVLWSDVLFEAAHGLYTNNGFRPTGKTRSIDPINPTSIERFFTRENT